MGTQRLQLPSPSRPAIGKKPPTPTEGTTSSSDARRDLPLTPRGALDLQRAAGNAAVARALGAGRTGPRLGDALAVQRHSAFEHALMGDTRPKDVEAAHAGRDTTPEVWRHILEEEYARAVAFKDDARYDPTADYPQVRWIRLGTSRLWVSMGELSALGDYLPDPGTIDTLPAKRLIPVLQHMRQTIARSIWGRLRGGDDTRERNRQTRMAGAAGLDPETATFHNPLRDISGDAAEVNDLDKATADLGPNRQKGLLARNACHFAPFSWERWALYHNEARNLARAAHAEPTRMSLRMRNARRTMKDDERRAWVANGYANHFLQDSFAAGHLVNKTLVMQWFVEYLNEQGFGGRPKFGLPGKDVMAGMTTRRQPGIAGRNLYANPRLHTSSSEDRASGRTVTDPQTTLERGDNEGRYAGSGVRSRDPEPEKEFAQYEGFLNSTFISLAALDIHDHFNRSGLTVKNAAGYTFVVGGDGKMLELQSEESIGIALRANSLADDAVSDLLAKGETSITTDQIFELFPSQVVLDGDAVPLERWHDAYVKAYAREKVFPGMVSKLDYKVVRALGPKLVDDGRVLTPKD
jgi:hypothetical protein